MEISWRWIFRKKLFQHSLHTHWLLTLTSFFFRFFHCKHLMRNCGKDTVLAGNVETSFLEAAQDVCWRFELLLQDGIEPMWEDERNKRGGRWLVTLTKQQRRLDLDRYWLETVGLTVLVLFIPLLKPVTIIIISLTSPQSSTFITCWQP